MKKTLIALTMGVFIFAPGIADAQSINVKTNIPIYEKMEDQSKIIREVKSGEVLEVEDFFGDYYLYKQGWFTGYIKKEDIKRNEKILREKEINKNKDILIEGLFDWTPLSNSPKTSSNSIVSLATDLTGTPYLWAGQSLGGFDCSGFTSYVYLKNGIKIPRTSRDQFSELREVDTLEIGDLVFFNTFGEGVSHVGIYIGNDEFIHSSSSRKGVVTDSMNNKYYKERYLGARRP